MIQADAPMCEEWGWKKGRDGKEEPSECSHMPVGCCKSGFYVGDHCGCLVRCFGQTETLSSRLLFFCQYYFFTRNVQALSALGSKCGNFRPHCAPGLKCVYKKSRCDDPDFNPFDHENDPTFLGCLPHSYRTGICKSKNNAD